MDNFEAIYAFVRTIPVGRVLSYGEVGDQVGAQPRTVGRAGQDQRRWNRSRAVPHQ